MPQFIIHTHNYYNQKKEQDENILKLISKVFWETILYRIANFSQN